MIDPAQHRNINARLADLEAMVAEQAKRIEEMKELLRRASEQLHKNSAVLLNGLELMNQKTERIKELEKEIIETGDRAWNEGYRAGKGLRPMGGPYCPNHPALTLPCPRCELSDIWVKP